MFARNNISRNNNVTITQVAVMFTGVQYVSSMHSCSVRIIITLPLETVPELYETL